MRLVTHFGRKEYDATAVALGYFDGVHLGHRAVLGAAVRCAAQQGLTPAAFTFTLPHGGAGKGKAILTQDEKLRRMAACGIEAVLCPAFEAFSALTPRQFVQEVLVGTLGAKHVFSGGDFTFGAHKSGNVEILQTLCSEYGVTAHIVPTALYEKKPISSTRIRAALEAGDVALAGALLGAPYVLDGAVRHGQGLGRTLGFPTVNLTYPAGMLMPKSGVYVTQTCVDGVWRPSATGLGARPTVSESGEVTCETFLPGFTGDLYDRHIQVRFVRWLWETKKYGDLAELTDMVNRAAEEALKG